MSFKTNFSEFVDYQQYMKERGWDVIMCHPVIPYTYQIGRIKQDQPLHCKLIAFRFVDAIENSTEISWEN